MQALVGQESHNVCFLFCATPIPRRYLKYARLGIKALWVSVRLCSAQTAESATYVVAPPLLHTDRRVSHLHVARCPLLPPLHTAKSRRNTLVHMLHATLLAQGAYIVPECLCMCAHAPNDVLRNHIEFVQ